MNPITKQGKPISSALGYAQLLHANSTSELVKHGEGWVKRLLAMAAAPGTAPDRAEGVAGEGDHLRRMMTVPRSRSPTSGAAQTTLRGHAAGLGIHTLNLDADIGPWLQVLKLKGLKDDAERAGRTT